MTSKVIEKVVKELLAYDIARYTKYDKLREAGIEISAFDNEKLSDLAFDLIGFPSDNSREFQSTNPNSKNSRIDEENLFCRDYLEEIIHPFAQQNSPQDVNTVYHKLLEELKQARLEAPHLFMNIP